MYFFPLGDSNSGCSESSGPPQHGGYRSEQDAHVQPEGPLLNILPIEIDDILEIQHLAPSAHLPEPCYARLGIQPPEMVVLVLLEVGFEERPGTNERHLADQDIEKLRKLVQAPSPQKFAEPRRSRVVPDLEEAGIAGVIQMRQLLFLEVRALAHRPELDHPETLSSEPSPLLEEERRACGVQEYGERDEKENRREQHQQHAAPV